jgi:hypothetical protein
MTSISDVITRIGEGYVFWAYFYATEGDILAAASLNLRGRY